MSIATTAQAGPQLRTRAEGLASVLPPLMVQAEHLASTVLLGAHGRRRSGMGDEFWQYRPIAQGDEVREIDWRRSAKSDVHFIRQKEWQAAQSVVIWVDGSRSMGYSGDRERATKSDRARLLALALSNLINENVGSTVTSNVECVAVGDKPSYLRRSSLVAGHVEQLFPIQEHNPFPVGAPMASSNGRCAYGASDPFRCLAWELASAGQGSVR